MAHIHVRLYEDNDGDIIKWLSEQENKTQAVKAAIRADIGGDVHQVDAPQVDAPEVTLVAIRATIEAALDQRMLCGAIAASGGSDDGPQGEDPELAAKLDSMF